MLLFVILGVVVLLAAGVVVFLFYLLNKESVRQQEAKAVAILNPQEILKPSQSSMELEYKRRVDELETQLREISGRGAAQAQQAMNLVEQLTKEKEDLIAQHFKAGQESARELETLQQQTLQMQRENAAAQLQLDAAQAQVMALQEEAVAMKKRVETELAAAQETVQQARQSQSEQSLAQSAALAKYQATIEELHEQMEALQLDNSKLKELNDAMMEKNRLLQNELVKHRAQASGLERLCENYRMQLESRV